MPAADPTYPLYPVACILASSLLLLVLATSFARQSWNLGVAFLCFWLFWELLTNGIDTVVWSDNDDVKLYVYCDMVSHLHIIAGTVKPVCTLIILRRLYLICSLRSVELPSSRERRNNMIIEWTLGLIIPLLAAGPLYYIVQDYRFQVQEGFGCENAYDGSILSALLIHFFNIVPPLISLAVYYPKVVWVFYRQRRDTNHFLRSSNSISHTHYFRILALASVDLLFTLPSGVSNLVITIIGDYEFYEGHIPFYGGWSFVHHPWAPVGVSYAAIKSEGAAVLVQRYLSLWTSPTLAFIIFGLFGVTAEARATYWRAVCFVGSWFGWTPKTRESAQRPALGTMEFGARPQVISFDAELGSRPSFVNFEPIVAGIAIKAEGAEAEKIESVNSDSLDSDTDIGHRLDRTITAAPPREESRV